MAASSLGSLVVSLGLDAAEFTAGLTKAQYTAQRSLDQIAASAKSVQGVMRQLGSALGVSVSIAGVVALFEDIKQKTEESQRAVAQLNAVLIATGTSAGLTAKALAQIGTGVKATTIFSDEDIRKAETALLRFRSVQTGVFEDAIKLVPDLAAALGTDLPTAAVAMGRALEGTGGQMRLLKAAGLNLKETQIDLAARMRESGDIAGAQRVTLEALAQTIGGASEADTTNLYGATKRLSRSFSDLEIVIGEKFAGEGGALSKLTKFFDNLADGIKNSQDRVGGFFETLKRGATVAGSIMAGAPLPPPLPESRRSASGFIGGVDPREEAAREAALNANLTARAEAALALEKAELLRRAEQSASFYALELTKQQAFLQRQQTQLAFGYERGTVTVAAFFDAERKSAADAYKAVQDDLEKQAADQARILSSNSYDPAQKAAAEARLRAITMEDAKAFFAMQQKILKADQDQVLAVQAQTDAYAELAAQAAATRGNTALGAGVSFDIQHRDEIARLQTTAAAGDAAARVALENAAAIRKAAVEQAALNDLARAYATVLAGIDIEQSRIDLAVQTGTETEIGGLVRRADAAKAYIGVLSKAADAAAAVATTPEQLLAIDQLRLKIAELAAESDVLAKKFRDIFEGSFTTFLTDIVSGTKSVKQAFLDMAKSIEQSISQIAAKNISEQLFGKGGPLGGISDFFASAFGGKGSAMGDLFGKAGDATGAASLTAAGSTLGLAGTGLSAAALALESAAASLSVSGSSSAIGGGIGSLFGGSGVDSGVGSDLAGLFGGGFASGGSPPLGKFSIVGERGPELFFPRSRGTVIPNSELTRRRFGSPSVNISINVPGNVDSRTASQIAREAGLATRRAMSR